MKAIRWIEKILICLAQVLIVLVVAIITYAVIMRYMFGNQPDWAYEVAIIFVIAISFIGMVIVYGENLHIKIAYFVDKIKSLKVKNLIYIFDDLCVLIFASLLLVMSVQFIFYNDAKKVLPATQLPHTVEYYVIPISAILLILYAIIKILHRLKNFSLLEDI